jgi:NADH dehydrogenase [ubiquinone] 1 alpha subcomplex assembly factor 5
MSTLVCDACDVHKTEMDDSVLPPEIFDRKRRRTLRERAARRGGSFLWEQVADELAHRLSMVTRDLADILIIGPIARHLSTIVTGRATNVTVLAISPDEWPGAVVAEEDRLPFSQALFDCVISAGTLDSVNDLPGALIQMRRVLKPDGLFLGQMWGAGTLGTLKAAMLEAEGERAAPHIHPQVDLRSAAELLTRAGFALPVADSDVLPVRYGDWRSLVADVRDAGVGNALAGGRSFLGRDFQVRLDKAWRTLADDAVRVEERFVHLYLSGWAPSAAQPRPARRGSGEVSLTQLFGQAPE